MTAGTFTVTEPGVVDALPEAEYHADPVPGGSLSSGGARTLIKPGGPARFAYERSQPPVRKRCWDIGSVAHKKVLGAGPDIVTIHHPNYRKKAAQELRDQAHEVGAVPLLFSELEQINSMVQAIREHPIAGPLFADGQPEHSGFWQDPETDVWCRFRPDWMSSRPGRRLVLADYKTCTSAAEEELRRDVWKWGYHIQRDWYLTGARALDLHEDPLFVFVCQEKTPPYLIHVIQLDRELALAGARASRRARQIYADCVRAGRWPGYPADEITTITAPAWAPTEEYA